MRRSLTEPARTGVPRHVAGLKWTNGADPGGSVATDRDAVGSRLLDMWAALGPGSVAEDTAKMHSIRNCGCPIADWSVQFRMIGGRLAPYLPIAWVPPNTPPSQEVRGLKEVWCGPSVNPELTEKVVRDLLIAEHCWNVRVLRSQVVPLRT
jgi:hypothetical protein